MRSFERLPCAESFLSSAEAHARDEWREYPKFRLATGEMVYHLDEIDRQAESSKMRLLQLACDNHSMLLELGLGEDADAEQRMKGYMQKLHEYNEWKDVAQALIGRLAVLRDTTTKALYPDFGLEMSD